MQDEQKSIWKLRVPYFKGIAGPYRLNNFEFDVDENGEFEIVGKPMFGIGVFAKRIWDSPPK